MRPSTPRVWAPAMRPARQRQSLAVFVAWSTTKPLPSQSPKAQVEPLRDRAAELRERDHRHAELAREDLEAAAQLADGRDAAVVAAVGAHQLQVVDDDQAQAPVALTVQPPGLGADLEHADVA